MLHALDKFDVSQCHGCGLCAMVCPVYQQGGDVMQTPHGMAKASQSGDELKRKDVFACMLCGACAPFCPQGIDLMQMLVAMRSSFSEQQSLDELPESPADQKGEVVFIADKQLAENQPQLEQVMQLLGNRHAVMAIDQANDISQAIQAGLPVSHARLHQFLTSLQPVKSIVVSDGLLQQIIKTKLPQIPMQSLGEVLSSRNEFRQQLNADDFYVMDSQAFSANYAHTVAYYDQLQKTTDCQLSWDLHRQAIPPGALASDDFNRSAQIQWLLQGRSVKRIVVESAADYALLKAQSELPVIHVAALLL